MKGYMKPMLLAFAALAVAAVILMPANLRADDFDLKTFITVDQPFQVPGATLAPNTQYILKRLDHYSTTTNHHVLEVLSSDGKVISTFFAASAERLEPTGKTVLSFYETAPGFARPVYQWFYPGRLIGYEFIYPKAEMRQITAHLIKNAPAEVQTAQAGPENYTTAPSDEEVTQPAEQGAIAQNTEPEAQPQEIQREKPSDMDVQAEPESTPSQTDQTTSEQMNQETTANSDMPAQLPKTAGELPLLLLLGIGSLSIRKFF